jgi:6-phosphogluconolactonase
VSSGGGGPCHLTLDRSDKFLITANYSGGTFSVIPVKKDVGVGEVSTAIKHEGGGANKKSQASPRPHCITLDAAPPDALCLSATSEQTKS